MAFLCRQCVAFGFIFFLDCTAFDGDRKSFNCWRFLVAQKDGALCYGLVGAEHVGWEVLSRLVRYSGERCWGNSSIRVRGP